MSVPYAHYYHEEQQRLFWGLMLFITSLSILGSIAIIVSYYIFPEIRHANSRIVVSLSFADLGLSICGPICAEYLFHKTIEKYAQQSVLCQFQASTVTYFSLASVCWLGTIAISNYAIVVLGHKPSFLMELLFQIVSWGLPLIPVIIALCLNLFGYYVMLWCSFAQNYVIVTVISLTTFLVPVSLLIVYCYYAIIIHVRQVTANSECCNQPKIDAKATYRMTGYIANYLVGWFPYYISYIYNYANPGGLNFWLQVIISGLAHSQGITNFFLYCVNRQFILMVRRKMQNSDQKSLSVSNARISSPSSDNCSPTVPLGPTPA